MQEGLNRFLKTKWMKMPSIQFGEVSKYRSLMTLVRKTSVGVKRAVGSEWL
jgi:hypothetical protein